jgi:uncharacterized protein YjiK
LGNNKRSVLFSARFRRLFWTMVMILLFLSGLVLSHRCHLWELMICLVAAAHCKKTVSLSLTHFDARYLQAIFHILSFGSQTAQVSKLTWNMETSFQFVS